MAAPVSRVVTREDVAAARAKLAELTKWVEDHRADATPQELEAAEGLIWETETKLLAWDATLEAQELRIRNDDLKAQVVVLGVVVAGAGALLLFG